MVKAWQQTVIIPTYKIGAPDKNPMFLEKRVYQGSSGVVYPHAVIDKVYDEKENKEWIGLFIENEYLKVLILPELGGRIQMAYDKTNDYHFVYYNQVIKPALVGLAGPWISGGIEFNWPQHHRPSTFEPTDFLIEKNADGSQTIWVNEYEKMFGTKCALGFTLYPGVAYIELHAKLYNSTPFPQTFLWWANPAVAVDEHYQSVFPPDVHAVFDHGKRDVSSFPIATGTYYKVDYSPGTDISRYNNIPVPTSYMAVNSAFDFVGGYHHQKKAGILHIANHHISPGKKQWTWGCGDFGQAWDRQLTDEDGPYLELMCGMYTDNQPDFGWIMPNEAREFKQYFMPYKNIGYVKNASVDAMINVEPAGDGTVNISVYITRERTIHIAATIGGTSMFMEEATLSPHKTWLKNIGINTEHIPDDLYITVLDEQGNLLVDYKPVTRQGEAIPDPATPINLPQHIATCEELYLAGLHLEQYRHATYNPLDYYEEALRRDASDIRCNNAKGLWLLRRGQFEEAEPYFRKAVAKLNKHNTNPYDGEPLYNLGLCLKHLQKTEEAFNYFYKSTWNAAMQDNAYLQLAYIAATKNNWRDALELIEKSIIKNYNSLKARHLKAIILRKLNRPQDAITYINNTLAIDAFDFASRFEMALCLQALNDEAGRTNVLQTLKQLMQQRGFTYIKMALQYAAAGLYNDATALLQLNDGHETDVLSLYHLAYFANQSGHTEQAMQWLQKAFAQSPHHVFPNTIEDVAALLTAVNLQPKDYKAWYYLGNYYYAKQLYTKTRECWEQSISIENGYATSLRNLGIAYYNKFNKKDEALDLFEQAFAADKKDARILFELDQLYKKLNADPQKRLSHLTKNITLVQERDDLYIEYITLHSLTGRFNEANQLLAARNFHPWEGGEGKVSGQYILIHVEMAKHALLHDDWHKAETYLINAQHYPHNLGEGKIYGAQENDIFYWLGCTYEKMNQPELAQKYWQQATEGLTEPAPAIFYNDQQPDKIFYQGLALLKLSRIDEARERFDNLINYAHAHINDEVKLDFFAVSLPDLMIFDDDLTYRNKIHCYYLMGLGYMGLKDSDKAIECFDKVLQMDQAHLGAKIHRDLVNQMMSS